MNTFELHYRFADPVAERLSPNFLRLLIHIGEHSLQFSILDPETNMFISLTALRLKTETKTPELFADRLRQLFIEENAFRRNYQSVIIGMESPVSTFVPSAMFDREHLHDYLRFNFRIPENAPLFSDHIADIDASNIYSLDPMALEVIRGQFPGATMVHAATALARSFYQYYRLKQSPLLLFLHVREKAIDIGCLGENGLLFFNSFDYQCNEDILYFTLYAMDQLRLRVEETPVILSGLLDKDTATYTILSQYIPGITFASRPGPAGYSQVLHSLPLHYYQQLFGLALCGS